VTVLLLCLLFARHGDLLSKGTPAPAIDAREQDGRAFGGELDGRITVVDFFATWCPHCRESLAGHDRLMATFGDRVRLLIIDVDEEPALVRAFFARRRLPAGAELVFDRAMLTSRAWKVTGFPTLYVLDRGGFVRYATSGYAGGGADTAKYPLVSTGETGHAESVRVTFDPAQVTYGQLLRVFFSVAHDPTELNHQGNDEGTQYRSAVFFTDADQARVTQAYVAQLDHAKAFGDKIVTQIVPLQAFYPAEAYHQNYAALHPDEPYIMFSDAPKVAHLRQLFPDLYRGQ